MAENTTLARPYAEALFRLALEEKALARWSEKLQWLSAVSQDPDMQRVMGDPRVSRDQLTGLFESVSQKVLDDEMQRLLALLVHNHRLPLLPHIAAQYEALRETQEGILEARITSPYPLSDKERDSMVQALEHRFGRKIRADVHQDADLIGGVKVSVGDVIIDSSVRARIGQMAVALKR